MDETFTVWSNTSEYSIHDVFYSRTFHKGDVGLWLSLPIMNI